MCGEKNEEFNLSPLLGQNFRRIDAQEKVTGAAVYTGDLKLPGMLYGKVLRSPVIRPTGPMGFLTYKQTHTYVYTNTVPGGAFRGFGAPQVIYAYESYLDMVAHRLKLDPLDLRLQNILGKGEEYSPGNTPIDCDLKAGLRQVAELIGWRENDQMKIQPGVKRGKGIACGVIDGGGTNKAAHSSVRILMDGGTLLSFGSVEFGQGIRTALLQAVADGLSLSPESVYVTQLDTQSTPFDRGTNATSAVSVMGQAVQLAAANARRQLLAAAASVLGIDGTKVRLEDGQVVAGDKTLSFKDVMRTYYGDAEGEIMGKGFFKVPRNDAVPIGYPTPFWGTSIVGVKVEIDEMTGQVKIQKYVSLTDAGKMINPILWRGRMRGRHFWYGAVLVRRASIQ